VQTPSFLAPFTDVAAPGAQASLTATSRTLSISIEQPTPTNWCWAATAAAVASFYAAVHGVGQALTACQVATQCLFTSCCPEPTDPTDPRNQEYALEGALRAIQHLAGDGPLQGPLDFPAIVTEIEGERPICCHIAWDPSNPDNGHFNAIVGYDTANQDIDISDCLYGTQTLPHDTFTTAYRGAGTWDLTYLTS
jgi:papain like cysteine protease AvrRpt2